MTTGDVANLVAESEDTSTLLGVSAMKARLLYQAVGYLAQIAALPAVTLNPVTLNPVCLDQKTIDAIGAALCKALADAFQHQFDAANCAIADLKKSRTDDETRIVQLQTAASTFQQEAQTLTEHIGRLEEHTRQAQAHYEILAENMGQLTERMVACEQILSRLKPTVFVPLNP